MAWAAGVRDRRHHHERAPTARRTWRVFTKQRRRHHGGSGYPQLRLLALVACGTRTVIDAVFGPTSTGETTYAPRLLRSLRAGMLLLADRNFAASDLLAAIAATGADLLVRCKTGRPSCRSCAAYRDGSYLSVLGGLQRPRHRRRDHHRHHAPAAAPASTGWSPPCSTPTATPPPN